MVIKNDDCICKECKCRIECCFCSCPYCGENTEDCCCNIDNPREATKVLPAKYYSKQTLSNQSKKPNFMDTKNDDWWRLEKWQIGRSRFP